MEFNVVKHIVVQSVQSVKPDTIRISGGRVRKYRFSLVSDRNGGNLVIEWLGKMPSGKGPGFLPRFTRERNRLLRRLSAITGTTSLITTAVNGEAVDAHFVSRDIISQEPLYG